MVAQRTLTPYVRVRILLPLPKDSHTIRCGCLFLRPRWIRTIALSSPSSYRVSGERVEHHSSSPESFCSLLNKKPDHAVRLFYFVMKSLFVLLGTVKDCAESSKESCAGFALRFFGLLC